jgi:UDP-N-acetylmuramate dehydrogenase
MMAARSASSRLVDRLPPVRGRYKENAPLAPITWFRVGGPAEVMFRPADEEDLASFLAQKPADVPVMVLGVGSNLLIRDGGVPGVVVRLGRAFAAIAIEGETVSAGAGALDLNVAISARDAGVAGLEFLSGIPGTIGGALRMNAGAYGAEMKDVVIGVRAVDGSGHIHMLKPSDLGFSYRRSSVPADWIFLAARLRGQAGDAAAIARRMDEIRSAREESQPVRARTGGSTFVNPQGEKAWALIEKAGCRGLAMGGAQVSEKHCNFLINTGNATAADLETLGEEVRRRVLAATGVELRWEIKRVGLPAAPMRPREVTS